MARKGLVKDGKSLLKVNMRHIPVSCIKDNNEIVVPLAKVNNDASYTTGPLGLKWGVLSNNC